ncbi:sulfurtransferase TusA family protein [Phycicoccus duodecadis]|uniref:tRNA 2-thiouridine synthesizing protein A n=1 Tax=Phycicoccus duodecadis TaxID=173053 RepID=A0A2N3YFK4_9MICO|nr:sulfurtransferase TusA family protein [Phycicoccus duodecadis]PKW25615.1 tRNA 2-thiouridine synthesizing protein A [Phycicoccus duodecadis]
MSAPEVVDARGTRCPTPVIRAARASRGRPAGTVLVLLADDEAARSDVPAWCRMRGHTVVVAREEGWTRYTVVLGGAAASGPAARPAPSADTGSGSTDARST